MLPVETLQIGTVYILIFRARAIGLGWDFLTELKILVSLFPLDQYNSPLIHAGYQTYFVNCITYRGYIGTGDVHRLSFLKRKGEERNSNKKKPKAVKTWDRDVVWLTYELYGEE